jgi:hypothetical protein
MYADRFSGEVSLILLRLICVDLQLVLRSFRPANTLSPGLAKEDSSAVRFFSVVISR